MAMELQQQNYGGKNSEGPRVPTSELVQFLSRPSTYPHRASQVQTIETHLSWVFLVGSFVYKLKKAVKRPGADFRKLAARKKNCLEELRLNRRLAPDCYLEVIPVSLSADGQNLQLDGPGSVLDYLVKMVRLPADRMLDRRLARGDITPAEVRPVAQVLSDFYTSRRPEGISKASYRKRLRRDCLACEESFQRARLEVPIETLAGLSFKLHRFLKTYAHLLDQRVEEHRIIEGHGDLRPEHICLTQPPVVFDCLEFRRSLRVTDPLAELGFLAVECERMERRDIGAEIVSVYRARAADTAPDGLLYFYMALAAFVRAKLAAWHLDDPEPRGTRYWLQRVHDYLELTDQYSQLAITPGAPQR